jgi:hypothetical protein
MKLLIGDKVCWEVGNTVMKAVFLEESENKGFSKVVTHLNGNRKHITEMEVLTSILKKGWDLD